jgi:DNA-binding winged helix-turn-helix (wHTH) protein
MNEIIKSEQSDTVAFQLGDWHVEPALRTLTRGELSKYLEPRVMRLLTYLVAAGGRVVSRQELLDEVWGDVEVNEEAVSRAISELRKALADDIREPKYLQTLRKSGYRLLLASTPLTSPGQVSVSNASPAGRQHQLLMIVATTISLIVLGALLWPTYLERLNSVQSPLSARLLTSYPGREIDPAIDTAGERVAFAWNGGEQGGDYDVYVKRIATDEMPTRLTHTQGFEGQLAWSPDGSSVAFVRNDGNHYGVWQVSWNGEDERKLLDLEKLSFGSPAKK